MSLAKVRNLKEIILIFHNCRENEIALLEYLNQLQENEEISTTIFNHAVNGEYQQKSFLKLMNKQNIGWNIISKVLDKSLIPLAFFVNFPAEIIENILLTQKNVDDDFYHVLFASIITHGQITRFIRLSKYLSPKNAEYILDNYVLTNIKTNTPSFILHVAAILLEKVNEKPNEIMQISEPVAEQVTEIVTEIKIISNDNHHC